MEKRSILPSVIFDRKNIFRGVIIIALICVAAFTALHFFLNSRYVRDKIMAKAARVTQSPFRYDNLSIGGVNQVNLNQVSFGSNHQVTMEKVKVSVDYKRTLKSKSLIYNAISAEGAVVHIDLDAIAAQIKPRPAPPAGNTKVRPIRPPRERPPATNPPEKPINPPSPKTSEQHPVRTDPLPPQPRRLPLVTLSDTKVVLKSKHLSGIRIALEGCSIKTADSGGEGEVKCERLVINDHTIPLDLAVPFRVEGNTFTIDHIAHLLQSTTLSLQAQGSLTHAMPYKLKAKLTRNHPLKLQNPSDDMLHVTIEEFQSVFKSKGALLSPQSHRARLSATATNVTPAHKTRGGHTFQHCVFQVTYNRGRINIPRFSLESDPLKFIGNGTGTLREADMVCRVVTSPEWRDIMRKFTRGSLISQKFNIMEPLDTSDRYYWDIYFSLTPEGRLEFHADPDRGWTSLDSFLPSFKQFITRELWTEEQ